MISYQEALGLTLDASVLTEAEKCPLSEALGRVLAQSLIAPFRLPRFDNSAVDGYALSGPTSGTFLEVVRTIGAGESAGQALQLEECARIFTGAPVPPEAYAVVMQEDVVFEEGKVRVIEEVKQGQNIRLAGEEFAQGAVVLNAGVIMNPAGIAAAAAIGCSQVSVHRPPTIGIVVTGAELVAPTTELGEAQIYESNSFALSAALQSLGLAPAFIEVIDDDPQLTLLTLRDALSRCDLLITSGGVSVGDRDVVKDALENLGVQKVYWGVAIKPGKPVYFGMQGQKAVFGLPGNPLSVLTTFTLLAKPFIKACMGFQNPTPPRIQARLQSEIIHKPGRQEFVPANLDCLSDGLVVTPILGQGSHMLGGMARANCMIEIPTEAPKLSRCDIVWILPFGQVAV